MKKFIMFVLTLALSAGLCVSAFAADNNNNTKYNTLFELLDNWDENGYPDYVNYVSKTKEGYPVTIVLVKGSTVTKDDIQKMYKESYDFDLVTDAPYSYNELQKVCDEIASTYIKTKMNGSYSKVESCEVGWKDEAGFVIGFGQSNYEARVIVWVPEAGLSEITSTLTEKYGDMVHIQSYVEKFGERYYLTAPGNTGTTDSTAAVNTNSSQTSTNTGKLANAEDKTDIKPTDTIEKEPGNCEEPETSNKAENKDAEVNKSSSTIIYFIIIAVVIIGVAAIIIKKVKK